MKLKHYKGAAASWVKGAIIGIAAATLVSIVLTLLAANLVLNGKVGESGNGWIVFLTRILSVVLGGLIGTSLSKEKMLPTISVIAVGYLLVLLAVGIVFFNGSFHKFGSGLLSVLIGGAIVCLLKLTQQKNKNKAIKARR